MVAGVSPASFRAKRPRHQAREGIMNKMFSHRRYLFLLSLLVLSFGTGPSVFSQHEGHNMPGMNMPKSKPKVRRKSAPRKKRPVARRKQPVKKHNMANMAGMQMPAASPTPSASPEKTETQMHMPGMQMPAS